MRFHRSVCRSAVAVCGFLNLASRTQSNFRRQLFRLFRPRRFALQPVPFRAGQNSRQFRGRNDDRTRDFDHLLLARDGAGQLDAHRAPLTRAESRRLTAERFGPMNSHCRSRRTFTAVATFYASIVCLLVVLSVRIAWAQQRSAVSVGSGSNSASPPPGSVVNATNASTYAQFLPPAAEVGINHGMTMR